MKEKEDYIHYEDLELVSLFVEEQDREAMAVLYDRYKHLVYGMGYKYLKDHFDTDDMTMEVWAVVMQDLPKREIHNFKSWLYTTIKNQALNIYRKNKRQTTIIEEISENVEKKSEFFMENDPSSCLYSRGKLEITENDLRKGINSLPEGQKECIRQFYLEQSNYKEIAEETGYELNMVKSFLQNGKRKLKLFLQKNGQT